MMMAFHAHLYAENGEVYEAVLRQLIHEVLSGTLSDEDEEELEPEVERLTLTLSGANDALESTFDLEEYALESVGVVYADFGLSMISGEEQIDAWSFGYDAWYVRTLTIVDESFYEYVTGVTNTDTFMQRLQTEWIYRGWWTGSALTSISARDLPSPWFLREMSSFKTEWGAEIEHYVHSKLEEHGVIPDDLLRHASDLWNVAVSTDGEQVTDVPFGRWEPASTPFNAWVLDKTIAWRDTGNRLSDLETVSLRHVCLRLAMVETGKYG